MLLQHFPHRIDLIRLGPGSWRLLMLAPIRARVERGEPAPPEPVVDLGAHLLQRRPRGRGALAQRQRRGTALGGLDYASRTDLFLLQPTLIPPPEASWMNALSRNPNFSPTDAPIATAMLQQLGDARKSAQR